MARRRRAKLGATPAYASTLRRGGGDDMRSTAVGGVPAARIMPRGAAGGPPGAAGDGARHDVIHALLAGLKRGVESVAGWVAAADMLLESHEQAAASARRHGVGLQAAAASGALAAYAVGGELDGELGAAVGSAQAAVDAARQGLCVLARRALLGHESMEQARARRRRGGADRGGAGRG
eukprot:10505-Chlamydomonas_euryale.AAC.2